MKTISVYAENPSDFLEDRKMIICEGKELPDTFQGYKTADLLKIWEEIQNGGTKAPEEQIAVMGNLLRKYRLGLFGAFDGSKKEAIPK